MDSQQQQGRESAFNVQGEKATMKALVFVKSSQDFRVLDISKPGLTGEDDVLIKVKAGSICPLDLMIAHGVWRPAANPTERTAESEPVGFDVAGVIVEIGSSVKNLKVGDEVYSRVPDKHRGTIAEYALSTSSATARKPASISFPVAASLPMAALAAAQVLDIDREHDLDHSKVFIPGALSGIGNIAVQLAVHLSPWAGEVITTASPDKIPAVREFLGREVAESIQVLDYTKVDLKEALRGVTLMVDTMGDGIRLFPVMRQRGKVLTLAKSPRHALLKLSRPARRFARWVHPVDSLRTWYTLLKAKSRGIEYVPVNVYPDGPTLKTIAALVDQGKIRPLVGMRVKLTDEDAIRKGVKRVLDGKGMLGKLVIDIL